MIQPPFEWPVPHRTNNRHAQYHVKKLKKRLYFSFGSGGINNKSNIISPLTPTINMAIRPGRRTQYLKKHPNPQKKVSFQLMKRNL